MQLVQKTATIFDEMKKFLTFLAITVFTTVVLTGCGPFDRLKADFTKSIENIKKETEEVKEKFDDTKKKIEKNIENVENLVDAVKKFGGEEEKTQLTQ